jgi:hypothetical protein
MTILALDIGLNLGWAAGLPGIPFVSGTMVFSPTGGDIARLYYAVRSSLTRKIEEYGIERVIAEAPIHVPTNNLPSLETTFGLHATASLLCKDRGIRYRREDMGDVRREVLGVRQKPRGIKSDTELPWIKQKAFDYCVARGWEPKDHNAADALINLEFECRRLDSAYAAAHAGKFFLEAAS